jgi:serine/threonine protein kinase/tetratricopeptide (TPR) repeat protein
MDAVRWERIQTMFHRATELPADERDAFIGAESRGDAELAARVRRMLEADRIGGTIVDEPLANVVGHVMTDLIPAAMTFGPYRVERLLGEGGMGVVYLAERSDLHSRAAVKVLRDAWLSPDRRERFAAEQRMLAQLNHPGIARLYDAGTLGDGTPWIAMEHVTGVSLTEYRLQQRCSLRERLRLFREVCDAVGHAHRHLIVHRDLKPSNIMVTPEGSVKLLDFGIAKQLEPDLFGDLTRTGMRAMTPGYAAPEQLLGEPIGVHTDIYTLGVVLYELLAGQLPFDVSRSTPEAAAMLMSTRAPERPSSAARGTAGALVASAAEWADLDVLCFTAMHADAQRRYQTVEAFARDVDHFLRGQPLDARPDSVGYRLSKFTRRHRLPLATAAVVVVSFIGLASFYAIRLSRARNAAVASAERAERVQRFTLDLFNGGDEDQGAADSLRVGTLIDRGVGQTQQLANEPAVQAEMFLTFGRVYMKLGRYDRADSLLRLSLERRRAALGVDHPDVAASLLALADLRESEGKLPEAEQFARQAVTLLQRVRPPGHPDIPNAMTELARMLEGRQHFPEAIALLNESVRLQSGSSTNPRDLGKTLQVLCVAHTYAGHLAPADSICRAGLAIDRRAYDKGPQIASDIMNIGSVAYQRADYVTAERAYREGEAMYEAWFGKDHLQTAAPLFLLAQPLIKLSRPDEAAPLLKRALAIEDRVRTSPTPLQGHILNALGGNAAVRGNQPEAERYFLRSVDIMRAVYGPNSAFAGAAQANIAGTWIARHDYPRAERLLRDALAIYAKTLSPGDVRIGAARAKLGRALVLQSRWRDAEPELLAGYEIGNKEAPTSEWARAASEDLATTYTALGRLSEARKYQKPTGAPTPR